MDVELNIASKVYKLSDLLRELKGVYVSMSCMYTDAHMLYPISPSLSSCVTFCWDSKSAHETGMNAAPLYTR